ncbi:MAG: YraN family protein [Dysgonamonadaceae bacterium]|jgi:putative endonuclease|nr:YraN family protein [Candidatus Paceibacterota bacterium]MDD4246342.1 YraN family protein [Dysgonamonadaceae bacterium]MDD4605808.1 YraN family protein [Dysgonamonadaceae bacterium]HUI33494.1 YraN family protein [Dysgonamonadaceae bacterium]
MAEHNELGKQGEIAAANFLRKKGYKVLKQNWRMYRHEIDIVAEDGEFIVFVEVKTRTSRQWGNPEDFIGKNKIRRIVEAADLYLQIKDIDKPARFDIISSVWNGKNFDIEHIDDAFMSPLF